MGGFKQRLVDYKNRLGIGMVEDETTDYYERWKKIVPESISANEGEIPIRQYTVAVLRTPIKFMRAIGRLQATNKRLIFRATGRSLMGRTTLQHEFRIDEIGGIEIRKDWRFGIFSFIMAFIFCSIVELFFGGFVGYAYQSAAAFGIIVSLIFGLAGLIPFFTMKKKFLFKALASSASSGCFYCIYTLSRVRVTSIWGLTTSSSSTPLWGKTFFLFAAIAGIVTLASLFLIAFRPNLAIFVKTKGAGGAIEICRDRSKGIFGSKNRGEYTGYSEVLPTEETETAIKELGAMISDIHLLGDLGIEKWKRD